MTYIERNRLQITFVSHIFEEIDQLLDTVAEIVDEEFSKQP